MDRIKFIKLQVYRYPRTSEYLSLPYQVWWDYWVPCIPHH